MMRSPVRRHTRQLRLAAAIAVAGLAAVAGAVAWSPTAGAGTTAPAGAGRAVPEAEATDQVRFSGGCGLLGTGIGGTTAAEPSQLAIAAGERVEFANDLGRTATLHLDGEPVAEVADGGSVAVTFFEGPVTASMRLGCALNDPAADARVSVAAAAAPTRAPQPAAPPVVDPAPERPDREPPAGEEPRPAPGAGSGTDDRDAVVTAPPAPAGGPDGGADPAWAAPAGPAPAPSARGPAGGWWPGEPPAGSEPAQAGAEDGEPAREGAERAAGEAGAGAGDRPTDRRPDGAAAGEAGRAGEPAAVEPLRRTSSTDQPIGALALVATICLVGVSAGAVRTIILAQRGNRSRVAA